MNLKLYTYLNFFNETRQPNCIRLNNYDKDINVWENVTCLLYLPIFVRYLVLNVISQLICLQIVCTKHNLLFRTFV